MLLGQVGAAEHFVSPEGDNANFGTRKMPWKSLQYGIDRLKPGDTVTALPGTYHEKIEFNRSGTAGEAGTITLRAEGKAIISGAKSEGDHIIAIYNQSYIRVIGLELRDNLDVDDGSAIRVEGTCSHIELRDNIIHNMRGKDAMGITVYGTSPRVAVTEITIDGNQIYDCEPAKSEALVLNGNIDGFEVTNNIVRDVNNIGIDFIGGEKSICRDTSKVTRNGVCANNTVLRARSNYGGGYAAGIYIDGAKNILVEGNTISGCDLGIEIGAENKGSITTGVTVRGNRIFKNDKAGITMGGYSLKAGSTEGCIFIGNTLYRNTLAGKKSQGEIWLQVAKGNRIENNTVVGQGGERPLLLSEKLAGDNTLKNNVWFSDSGAESSVFVWRGKWLEGFAAYSEASGQGAGSRFEKPDIDAALAAAEKELK